MIAPVDSPMLSSAGVSLHNSTAQHDLVQLLHRSLSNDLARLHAAETLKPGAMFSSTVARADMALHASEHSLAVATAPGSAEQIRPASHADAAGLRDDVDVSRRKQTREDDQAFAKAVFEQDPDAIEQTVLTLIRQQLPAAIEAELCMAMLVCLLRNPHAEQLHVEPWCQHYVIVLLPLGGTLGQQHRLMVLGVNANRSSVSLTGSNATHGFVHSQPLLELCIEADDRGFMPVSALLGSVRIAGKALQLGQFPGALPECCTLDLDEHSLVRLT